MTSTDLTNINLNILLLIVGGIGTLLGIIVSHFLAKSRSINELLFAARRETYSEFMKEFGMAFGPEKITFADFDELKVVETNYERMQKISRIFAQCRLVANPLLELKLRWLYDLVIADLENNKITDKKRERDYIGNEIEVLMRRDLNVIGTTEVLVWRLFSFWKRYKLRKNLANHPETEGT